MSISGDKNDDVKGVLVQELVFVDPGQYENQILPVQNYAESAGSSKDLDHVSLMSTVHENNVIVVGNGKFTDYSWDAVSTLKLLAYRKALSPLIASRSITRKHVFLRIAHLLRDLTHRKEHPTAQQCDNKWKWLKRKYCTVIQKMKTNPMESLKDCKFQYFKEMDEISKIENQKLQIQITKLPPKPKIIKKYGAVKSSKNILASCKSEDDPDEDDDEMETESIGEQDFQWDITATINLLDIKKGLDDLKLNRDKLFTKISELMAVSLPPNKDHPTAQQCDSRWRYLREQYNDFQNVDANSEKSPYFEKMDEMSLESDINEEDDFACLEYGLLSSTPSNGGRKRKRTSENLAQVYTYVNEANRDQKDRQFGHMVELMQARTSAIDRQTDVLKEILDHLKETSKSSSSK